MDRKDILERLKSLAYSTENEDLRTWSVLYWKAQGLTHEQIAVLLDRSVEWVQRYPNRTYKLFGVGGTDTEKKIWMEKECLEALRELVKGDPYLFKAPPKLPPELESEVNGPEVVYGEPVDDPIPTPKSIPRPEIPKAVALPPKPIPIRRSVGPVVSVFLIFAICFGLLVLTGGGIWLWNNWDDIVQAMRPASTNTPFVPTQEVPVAVPPTLTAKPTERPAVLPTSTPGPTDTPPPPTFTARAFYDADVWAELAPQVFIRLEHEFESFGSGRCQTPNPGFVFKLEIRNQRSDPFLLRYDPSSFSATDDQGTDYRLVGAGVNVCAAVGPQVVQDNFFNMVMAFEGQIPVDAKYLVLVAGPLSGGTVTFHYALE